MQYIVFRDSKVVKGRERNGVLACKDTPDGYQRVPIKQVAKRLIRSAAARAPSFVMLNFVFEKELEALTTDRATQCEIRIAARNVLKERPK